MKKTPDIKISDGSIEIEGLSHMESPTDFYDKLTQTLPQQCKELVFKLTYINSASSKCIYMFLEYCISKYNKPTINWYYQTDDEDGRDIGLNYAYVLNYPINIIEN